MVIDAGIAYGDGEPVRVRVRKRERRCMIDDRGPAGEKAGRPSRWLEVANRIVKDEYSLNVNRSGIVFVPAVEGGADRAELVTRVAECSAAVYDRLLDLDE